MPKYTKRIQSYQIQGSHLNEFEFQQDQGALAHTSELPFPNEGEQTNPDPAAHIAEVTAAAHRKVEKRRRLGLAPPATGKKAVARKRSTKKVAKKATKKAARKPATKAAKMPVTKRATTAAKKAVKKVTRKTVSKAPRKSAKKPAKRTT